MRIIKLEVERYGDRGIKLFKHAVSLDLKKYQKVASFIAYIQKICKLDKFPYELEIDGFQISKHDRTKALKQNVVYQLRISRSVKKDYQIRSSQVEESDDDSTPEVKSDRKSKVQQKMAKIVRKKKKESSSESDSSISSSDQDASSSSSSSESQQQVLPTYLKQKQKEKKVNLSKNEPQNLKPSIKNSKSQTLKIDRNVEQKTKNVKKIAPIPESSSSSSSSSQSDEQLPALTHNKKTNPTVVKSSIKSNLPNKAETIVQEKRKEASNSFINYRKKTVINGDSSSESEPSQQYHPKKRPQPTVQSHQKAEISKPQIAPSSTISNAKPKIDVKLPPALRNKVVKKNFDQHKENQWISIDKQKMKRWQQLGNKNICQINNKIRFKIVELDEQKFIPVKSGWITGQVKEVHENKTICLVKVEQEGKPYRQTYEIPEHNMDELQINRLLASKQQIECFEQKQQQTSSKQAEKPVQQKKQNQAIDPQNDKNSIEKFICGQANYYFSDKNYNTDLFMQMHANRHPQKYINLSFMLNFPKIKKVLQNQQKLYEYLKQDEKYEQRNYEIDFEKRLIRKKSIVRKSEQAEKTQQKLNQDEKVLEDKEQLQGRQLKSQ